MFKIISTKEYNDIKNHILILQDEISELESKKEFDFDKFLKEVLGREIRWVDTSKMGKETYDKWYNEAQGLLGSNIVKSLLGYEEADGTIINGEITKDLIEYIAKETKNYDEVMNARMKIVGIELLRSYLNSLVKIN